MEHLEGKIVIVTGAARGLGQAIMSRLVSERVHVVAVGRDQRSLDAAAEPFGDAVTPLAGDLGVALDVERVFAQVEAKFGKVNALINNAAIYDVFDLEEADPERIRYSIESNLLAPMLCIRKAVPLLRKAGGGDVINVSSESTVQPFTLLSAYGATKAGLEAFSRAMRAELKPDGIRVSTLRLGPMRGTARSMSPEVMRRFMEKNAAALRTAAEGGLMNLQSVAQIVTTLLGLPIDLACELIDLRPSGLVRT
jgi:meso-butanediol dehydrogenase / (S,S)-butanediol dehydrogenase / diacetyl reductase